MKIERSLDFGCKARYLWSIIRSFRSGDLQYAIGTITSVEEVDGKRIRTFVNFDGSKTVQVLRERDEEKRLIVFETIKTDLPVVSATSAFQVTGDDTGCTLTCNLEYELDGVTEEQMRAMFEDAWKLGVAAFKKRVESGR
ncbi:MAG: SRPBCC family protein [Hyphomicrobiales bacterium]